MYLVLLKKKTIAICHPRINRSYSSPIVTAITHIPDFNIVPFWQIMQVTDHIFIALYCIAVHSKAKPIQWYDLMVWKILTITDCENWKLKIHTLYSVCIYRIYCIRKIFELWINGFKNLSSNSILYVDRRKVIVYSKNIQKIKWNWNLKLSKLKCKRSNPFGFCSKVIQSLWR